MGMSARRFVRVDMGHAHLGRGQGLPLRVARPAPVHTDLVSTGGTLDHGTPGMSIGTVTGVVAMRHIGPDQVLGSVRLLETIKTLTLLSSISRMMEGMTQRNAPSGATATVTAPDGEACQAQSPCVQEEDEVQVLSQPLGGDSDLDSSVSAFEEAGPSFSEALEAVYKYLPPEVCPAPPDPVPRAKSLWEVGKESATKEMLKLPHSPTVAALLGDLQRTQGFDTKKVGCLTPKTFLQHQGLKFYAPHTESWPLKHPSLDEDAQKIGVSKASFPRLRTRSWSRLDVMSSLSGFHGFAHGLVLGGSQTRH